jgi:hypothetical protein
VLNPGNSINIDGTTTGANNDYTSFCGDTPTSPKHAPDVVYELTLPKDGTLKLSLAEANGSALEPALYVQTTCGTDFTCQDQRPVTTDLAVTAGVYEVIVDGVNGTSGDFTLGISYDLAKCGDGVINPGEDCDPGPTPVAGCDAPGTPTQCHFTQVAPDTGACPGDTVQVPLGTTVLAATQGNTTYGFTDKYSYSCAADPGGLDRVYQVVPGASGTLTASIGYEVDGTTSICTENIMASGCWAYALYARSTCNQQSTELACALDQNDPLHPESINFMVTKGTPYFVFVDGYNDVDSAGPFNLILNLK